MALTALGRDADGVGACHDALAVDADNAPVLNVLTGPPPAGFDVDAV